MRVLLTLSGLSLLATPALADDIDLQITIPQLNVAEYHRPYVAAWIANDDHSVAANLAVWYQLEKRGSDEGETWLKDLRQWWRRAGRSLDMPVDGLSGPTQAPGTHDIVFDTDDARFAELEPGTYTLVVEAVREVGGREMVSIPFSWPLEPGTPLTTQGEDELGEVRLEVINEDRG